MKRFKSISLALLLIVIMIFAVGCEERASEEVDNLNQEEPQEEVQEESQEEPQEEAQEEAQGENAAFMIGDTIKIEGFEITLNGVRKVPEGEVVSLEEGEKAIAFDVTVKNTGESSEIIGNWVFAAFDEEGDWAKWDIFTEREGEIEGPVEVGEKRQGETILIFPENHKKVEFIFEPYAIHEGEAIFEVELP